MGAAKAKAVLAEDLRIFRWSSWGQRIGIRVGPGKARYWQPGRRKWTAPRPATEDIGRAIVNAEVLRALKALNEEA